MKAKRKKAKKQRKKNERVRAYLEAVNEHCAKLAVALRNLAQAVDDVRSFHLDEEVG